MAAPWLAPWLKFASRCAGERASNKDDWFAMMTGRRAQASQPFGGWGVFGAQPPFGPPWFGGGPGWRASKARRGDVRSAILAVLAERSLNGYQIIQEIAERRDCTIPFRIADPYGAGWSRPGAERRSRRRPRPYLVDG